jgi:hypothetical protein
MNAGRASGIAGVFALLCVSALADDGASKPPSSPSTRTTGVVTGSEKAASDMGGRPKALPTKKDKQAAVDATTRMGSEASDRSWNRHSEPRGRKSWDEMTPAEQDAARRWWLLNSGDFGSPGVSPRAAPNSGWKPKGPYIIGPSVKPDDRNPAK